MDLTPATSIILETAQYQPIDKNQNNKSKVCLYKN